MAKQDCSLTYLDLRESNLPVDQAFQLANILFDQTSRLKLELLDNESMKNWVSTTNSTTDSIVEFTGEMGEKEIGVFCFKMKPSQLQSLKISNTKIIPKHLDFLFKKLLEGVSSLQLGFSGLFAF